MNIRKQNNLINKSSILYEAMKSYDFLLIKNIMNKHPNLLELYIAVNSRKQTEILDSLLGEVLDGGCVTVSLFLAIMGPRFVWNKIVIPFCIELEKKYKPHIQAYPAEFGKLICFMGYERARKITQSFPLTYSQKDREDVQKALAVLIKDAKTLEQLDDIYNEHVNAPYIIQHRSSFYPWQTKPWLQFINDFRERCVDLFLEKSNLTRAHFLDEGKNVSLSKLPLNFSSTDSLDFGLRLLKHPAFLLDEKYVIETAPRGRLVQYCNLLMKHQVRA